jgi:hypothetical protein
VEQEVPGRGVRELAVNARRLDAGDGHEALVLLAIRDVTGDGEKGGEPG